MINAQILYDLREEFEFCSGDELGEWFVDNWVMPVPGIDRELERPNMSPQGHVGFSKEAAKHLVLLSFDSISHNSPSMAEWAKNSKNVCLKVLRDASYSHRAYDRQPNDRLIMDYPGRRGVWYTSSR